MKPWLRLTKLVFALLAVFSMISCRGDQDNPLAAYEGNRPLSFQRVTQSYHPDIQWIGGRVAAVGVNRGNKAALDSTLIWIETATTDAIGPVSTVGLRPDVATVRKYKGTPVDSLANETEYTFWIAEKSVFDGTLSPSLRTPFSFRDTTFAINVFFTSPMQWGERDPSDPFGDRPLVTISIVRDEKLTGDKFIVSWTPDSIAFRRIGIRKGSYPGFTDLVWHVFLPDSVPDKIRPPISVPTPPSGAGVAVDWPAEGFEKGTVYFLWMVRTGWKSMPPDWGTFARGYSGMTFKPIPQ